MSDCECDDDMTADGHGAGCPNGVAFQRARAEKAERLAAQRGAVLAANGFHVCDLPECWHGPKLDPAALQAALDEARGRAERAEAWKMRAIGAYGHAWKALFDLSRWVERSIEAAGGDGGSGDWACAECRPHSDMLREGFRCARHAALALLAEVGT